MGVPLDPATLSRAARVPGDLAGSTASRTIEPACADARRFHDLVLPSLRASLGADVFGAWFGALQLDGFDAAKARLSVPTAFLRSWINAHYADRLLVALREAWPHLGQIEIAIRTAARKPAPAALPAAAGATAQAAPRPVPFAPAPPPFGRGDAGEIADFAAIVVGAGNAVAVAAARAVASALAEGGVDALRNPLVLVGATGVGKTLVAGAIASAARAARRDAAAIEATALGFLKAEARDAALRDLDAADLVVVDDLHHLAGTTASAAFAQLVRAARGARRQLVVVSGEPLCDLRGIDEETRGRLEAGLVTPIGRPDAAVRAQLIDLFATRHCGAGHPIRPAIRDALAQAAPGNGRTIDGMVRLLAHRASAGLDDATADAALGAVRHLIGDRPRSPIPIALIQRAVAAFYSVRREDLLSARRTANIVRPRQVAMALARRLTLRSLPEIGRQFGGRDHTTVLHAVRKIECLIARDPRLADELAAIEAEITRVSP